MKAFTVIMVQEKATKNTYRYEEQAEDGSPPRIGTQYLQKWALGAPAPAKIKGTVEEA